MSILGPLIGAAGSGLLQRTYFLQTNTPSGIPQILVVLDAITQETPEFSADVTQHPVEFGSEVSDHIQIKNPTLTLKGTISNTPLDLQTTIGNVLSGGLAAITSSQARTNILNTGLQQGAGILGAKLLGGAAGLLSEGLAGSADALARTSLLNAFESRQPFDVLTKRQRYESMVIEKLSFPRDGSTGYQLVFEMELIRLRIVSPLTVTITQVGEDVITSATGISNLGSQAAGGTSAGFAAAGNKSILRAGLGL